MRTIGVITVARSDYGIYLPVLHKIEAHPNLHLHLIVSGMHLSPEFGTTINAIKDDGFQIGDQFEMLLSSDSPEGIAKSIGLGTVGFAQSYAHHRPDLLLVLGDRFEMLSAAIAALPFTIPIAHIHGGESTEGLIDEPIRHSLTKMSHLHFASTQTYHNRIVQMGEEPWRVTTSGAPALDHLATHQPLSKKALETQIGLPLSSKPLLVTFHPVTLESDHIANQTQALFTALDKINQPLIFTYPNADTNGRHIIQEIDNYIKCHANARVVTNLGTQAYFSIMKYASAMVGNSSSGIIEAASFQLPVVNIGTRQQGRIRARNVIDVDPKPKAIADAIAKAISPSFKNSLKSLTNPYGNGNAAECIINTIAQTPLDQKLILKKFHNIPMA